MGPVQGFLLVPAQNRDFQRAQRLFWPLKWSRVTVRGHFEAKKVLELASFSDLAVLIKKHHTTFNAQVHLQLHKRYLQVQTVTLSFIEAMSYREGMATKIVPKNTFYMSSYGTIFICCINNLWLPPGTEPIYLTQTSVARSRKDFCANL